MASYDIKSTHYQSLLKKVIDDVTVYTAKDWVNELEYNFDSYWGHLELTLTVSNDVKDNQLIELRNGLLHFFNLNYPDSDISFEWQVAFKRKNQLMDILSPEDDFRDINERLIDLSI